VTEVLASITTAELIPCRDLIQDLIRIAPDSYFYVTAKTETTNPIIHHRPLLPAALGHDP
jgi:hypothetical protein